MHILFSALGYKPAYRLGGPITSVAATAESLVRLGHRVTVFTTNGNLDVDLDVPVNQPINVQGVDVWYFRRRRLLPRIPGRKPSVGFLYAPELRRALPDMLKQVDVVHTQNPFIYPTLIAGTEAARRSIPFFYQQRGALGSAHLKSRRLKKLLYLWAFEKRLLRSATGLIALTQVEVDSYRALGLSAPCHIVPNGLECSLYRTSPVGRLPDKWKLNEADTVVLYLGRLHHTKGVDRLVDAFIQVHDKYPKARLVLAGPDESGLEGQLRKKLVLAGADRQVIFTGLVTGEEKLNLLARADLFSLPSLAEGFSMSILEALASATPVLISPECNFPEVQAHSVGSVVDSSPMHLAAGLAQLLSNRDRLVQMRSAARKFVESNYSITKVTQKLVNLYASSLSDSQSRQVPKAA